MFTLPSHRGQGIARALVQWLEVQAQARGCQLFMLETGCLQPEAIALYESLGYSRRGPFGPYTEDPNSVFMQKSVVDGYAL
jgi:putative acetyltransferase